ncbi:SCP-like protein [Teladorsagia circumcincta]|uniref:SCP-like protein n=1 Tax=Teladorsagia circumcincta TaxID=45464 RepID=A0A2G9V1B6_TELCI|nr:SCP-like protein [Teladorsagia circumcincta]
MNIISAVHAYDICAVEAVTFTIMHTQKQKETRIKGVPRSSRYFQTPPAMLLLIAIGFSVLRLVLGDGNTPAAHCSQNNNGMTDEVRQFFVDKHNEYRSLIAKGLATNKVGGFAPKAARMFKVIYDCDVEQTMANWAKTCQTWQAPYKDRNGYGQNRFSIRPIEPNRTIVAMKAMENWFSQLAQIGVPQENMLNLNVFYRGVWYYTQLAWQWSSKIGCAIQDCSTFTYAGCEYNPSGNILGSMIYEIGEPCKVDADCKCTGCTCSVDEALCVQPILQIYDCDVEQTMMEWAKTCQTWQAPSSARKGYGQNRFSIRPIEPNKTIVAEKAVNNWFSQLAQKGVPQENMLNLDVFYRGVWYYTQLAWQWSYQLGCAVVDCNGFTYAGCEYNPSGNFLYSLIYEIGEPCQTDEDCKCAGCGCSQEEALCVPGVIPIKPVYWQLIIFPHFLSISIGTYTYCGGDI